MADYISREAMHKANQDEWQGVYGFVDCDIFEDNENMIDRVPSADVRPVVRARWYWDNYKYDWCCSNCFHSADHHIDKDDVFKMPSFPFCPHCGADMREMQILDTTKGGSHD